MRMFTTWMIKKWKQITLSIVLSSCTQIMNTTLSVLISFTIKISYCCIYIMFEMIQKWKFSLWIWVIMKKKDADDKIIIIRFDCNIIQDRNVTAKLLSSEHLSLSIWHIAKMQQINNEDYIYWVNVLFNFIEVLLNWLWINLAEFIKLNFILQSFRKYSSH
jgi:hypothetical protein